MSYVWIAVAAGVAIALALVVMRRPSAAARTAPADATTARRVASPPVGAKATAAARPRSTAPAPLPTAPAAVDPALPLDPALPPPAALAELTFKPIAALSEERRKALLAGVRQIPRPPRLLHHLVSADFVNNASAAQLQELIIGEPVIAARVLAHINSPAYALKTPVTSIGQAVTYLGLNGVRVICMRYAMTASFRADEPARQARLDAIWAASAIAGELAQQLGHRLGTENHAAVSSAVVLSFLGRLAMTAALPLDRLRALPTGSLVQRIEAEHRAMGIGASELGRLLMTEWALPEAVITEATGIDAVLTVAPKIGDTADAGLALGYVSARLGERLAGDELAAPRDLDLASDDPDWFRIRQRLGKPPLAGLPVALQAPELAAAVKAVRDSLAR